MNVPNTVTMHTACHWELDTAIGQILRWLDYEESKAMLMDPTLTDVHDECFLALNEAAGVPMEPPF